MKKLDRLMSYPARWRRSRGFGVHSPFAYHFITKVLREKDAEYYAYAEIAAFCPRARRAGFNEIFAGKDMSVPEAHMLFRVLCHFKPTEIIEIGHGHEVTNIIIERAVPQAKTVTWHPGKHIEPSKGITPFILINQVPKDHYDEIHSYLAGHLSDEEAVVVVRNLPNLPANRRLWQELTASINFGMGFSDNYMGIFVGLHSLPRQNYEIIL